jgi:cytochrome c-type biogenesis protein
MALDLLVALAAGAVSLLSPCMLPLLPGWFAYLAGDAAASEQAGTRARLVLHTAAFVAGFAAVFTVLGLGAGAFGGAFIEARRELEVVGGILIVLLGIVTFDDRVLPRRLRGGRGITATRSVRGPLGAATVGVVFALAWSPCIGPTLAAVLTIAATSGEALRGAALLAAFAIGIGAPLLLIAAFADQLLPKVRGLHRHLPTIRRVAGVALVVFGILVATGVVGHYSSRLSGIIPIEV